MKESKVAILIFAIFIAAGGVVFYFSVFSNFTFNFYKSELSINGANITEKLYFKPNKDYHTLFRDFENYAFVGETGLRNYLEIQSVECFKGRAYLKDPYGKVTVFPEKSEEFLSYTENNEYGCGFGDKTGFKKGQDYWIKASYQLHPENLFLINSHHYIKFIAYSRDRHKFLSTNSNFIINSDVVLEKISFPSDYTIIYIPYKGDISGFNIIRQDSFEFDSRALNKLLILLISLFPGLMFFSLWFFFGRERVETDIPEELSVFPHEDKNKKNWRKGWEVAAYFNPPFSITDRNFFSTLLLSLYHKKIIGLRMKDKKMFIKINNLSYQLDDIESKFLEILKGIDKRVPEKYKEGGYFDLSKILASFSVSKGVQSEFQALSKKIKEGGKKYISRKADYFIYIFTAIIFISFFSGLFMRNYIMPIFLFFSLVAIGIINNKSAILIRFKEEFYNEYKHWQAFKKYLNRSFAMKNEGHQAVVLWEHYLIYATALGVSEKVIKQLKKWNVIDESHYGVYMGINQASHSFAYSGGSSGHGGGGGFGGSGGGGVGGGGGGGR